MSVTKIGKIYRVEIRYKDYEGNVKRKTKSGFTTKKEAENWKNNEMYRVKRDSNVTFDVLCKFYLEEIKFRLKPTTYQVKERIINKKILPTFKNIKINEITPFAVREWQNMLLKTKNSNVYNRHLNIVFQTIMNYAVVMYDLPSNPVKQCGRFGSRESSKTIVFFNKEEFSMFIEKFNKKEKYYYPLILLYYTGIRFGELLALTKNDFDFENCSLNIDKNLVVVKGEKILTTPKTKNSIRRIALPDICIDEIKKYFKKLYDTSENDFIFNFSRNALRKVINEACDELKLNRISVHGFRHSHCSELINSGVSILDIAKRLGHKNEEVTLIYSHLFKEKHDLKYEQKYLNEIFK